MAQQQNQTPTPSADALPPEPLPWTRGIGPRFIALFLVIVYYDQLAPRTLAVGGLAPAVLGATIGGVLALLLLFYAPAMQGLRARKGLLGISESTFGQNGAKVVPGIVLVVGQVFWFAVCLHYAIDIAFRSLSTLGIMDPSYQETVRRGGFETPGWLFLWVALAWSVSSAILGVLAFRLTAAVMAGYQPFPALVLAAVVIWSLPAAGDFQPLGFDPTTAEPVPKTWNFAFLTMIQMVFGYFACMGVMAADWGAASRDETDVRLGGFVGVAVASTVLASLALLIVAGANGREPAPVGLKADLEAQREWQAELRASPTTHRAGGEETREQIEQRVVSSRGRNFTIRQILQYGIGGLGGGIALIVLNVGLLGPACYAPFVIGRRMRALFPVLPVWGWSMLGAVATWPLIWFRVAERLDVVFDILGALFAPVAGAISADAMRRAGRWRGPRRGVSLPGIAAWLVGVAVGLVPHMGIESWASVRPAAVLAFASAFVVYFALALVGLEPNEVVEPERETSAPEPVASSEPSTG